MATKELQGLLPGQVGDDLGVMEEEDEDKTLKALRPMLDLADAGVQADAKGVEVCHVGIQCFLRDSYDHDSSRAKPRRSSVS